MEEPTPSDAIKAAQDRITTADLEGTGKPVTVAAIEEAIHDIADSTLRHQAREVQRKFEEVIQEVVINGKQGMNAIDVMTEVEVKGHKYSVENIIDTISTVVFEASKRRVRKQAVRDFVRKVATPPKE